MSNMGSMGSWNPFQPILHSARMRTKLSAKAAVKSAAPPLCCVSCKSQIPYGSNFCPSCGIKSGIDAAPASSRSTECQGFLAEANLYRIRRSWAAAEAACISALAADSSSLPAHILLGDLYMDMGKPNQAAQWFRLATDLDPTSELAYGRMRQAEQAHNAVGNSSALNPVHTAGTQKLMGVSPSGWINGATVLAAIAVRVWQHPPAAPLVDSVVQLTDDGEPKNGRLDSDGSRVYFNEGPPGVNKIAQVSITGGRTAPVDTKLENPLIQTMSRDGSALLVSVGHIYDVADPLWSIPLPGGEPRHLGSIEAQTADLFPDGRIAFATGGEETGKELFVADDDGSNPRKLASLPGQVGNVEVSPDGRRILFMENQPGAGLGTARLLEIAADGTGLREVSKVSRK